MNSLATDCKGPRVPHQCPCMSWPQQAVPVQSVCVGQQTPRTIARSKHLMQAAYSCEMRHSNTARADTSADPGQMLGCAHRCLSAGLHTIEQGCLLHSHHTFENRPPAMRLSARRHRFHCPMLGCWRKAYLLLEKSAGQRHTYLNCVVVVDTNSVCVAWGHRV